MNIQIDIYDFALLVKKYKPSDKFFSDKAIEKLYQEVIDTNDSGEGTNLYSFLECYTEYPSIGKACEKLNMSEKEIEEKYDLVYRFRYGRVLIAKY